MESKSKLKELLKYLPEKVRLGISALSEHTKDNIREIRLKAGKPVILTLENGSVYLSSDGNICFLRQHGLMYCTAEDIEETFSSLCRYSVYAYKETLKKGYIPLENGCRAGVCGTFIYENGSISSVTSVNSLNIRISHEIIGVAEDFYPYIYNGCLIFGPPASGKTTFLRDAVRLVSTGKYYKSKRTVLIDTKGEIAAVSGGIPENDVGDNTDVLNLTEKRDGILTALSVLNPEIIAFDEIMTLDEAEAVKFSYGCGAYVLTTVHAGSKNEAEERTVCKDLLKSGIFKYAIYLKNVGARPSVYSVDAAGRLISAERSDEVSA